MLYILQKHLPRQKKHNKEGAMKIAEIYVLINSLNDEPFYIGATQNSSLRKSCHIQQSKKGKDKKSKYIQSIILSGGKIELLVLEKCLGHFADFWENFYIDLFRSWGFSLLQTYPSRYPFCYSIREDEENLSDEDGLNLYLDISIKSTSRIKEVLD